MEHILQHDWCRRQNNNYFISEEDLDNSVTEKILRNKFHDPLISSESEDEGPREKINWDEIFKKRSTDKVDQSIVNGYHAVPPFPKLSALTGQQHYQLLKILCAQKPDILPGKFIGRPSNQDYRIYEELEQTYLTEQKEFIEWAKTMWTTTHGLRALRPKPLIEMVYDADFKVAAHRMGSFPKNYSLAAQIPLVSANADCDLMLEKVLTKVNDSALPEVVIPDLTTRVYILEPYPLPEPCSKHPCRFTLPNESSMTILPLTEVQRELAQYAAQHGARHLAAEEALRCLLELDRPWLLAMSVCSVMSMDGEPISVVVLDSEFALRRECSQARSLKAYGRLLDQKLLPPSEAKATNKTCEPIPSKKPSASTQDIDDSDDEPLYIDTDGLQIDDDKSLESKCLEERKNKRKGSIENEKESKRKPDAHENKIGFYECTCRESFDNPPPRSYKKWKVINRRTNDKYSLIIHSPHKAKGMCGELVPAARPEYQLDVGARAATPHELRSQALALRIRKNAAILNVRIDSPTGEMVTTDIKYSEDFEKEYSEVMDDVHNRLFTVMDQLQGLMPGHYVLKHEIAHGDNALLYRPGAGGADQLALAFAAAQLAEPDEAKAVRAPPTLSAALLPVHKFRKMLPCAFTPYPNQLARPPRAAPRPRAPPRALKPGVKAPGKRKPASQSGSASASASSSPPRCRPCRVQLQRCTLPTTPTTPANPATTTGENYRLSLIIITAPAKITPVKTPAETTPATKPAKTTLATTPAETTPATKPAKITLATKPAETTPEKTLAENMPAITRAKTTPAITRATTLAKTTSVTTPAKTTPATKPAKTTLATTPAETTPEKKPAENTPAITRAKTTPAITPATTFAKTTPVTTRAKTTPVTTPGKTKPAATHAKTMSATTPSKTTPAKTPADITPVTTPAKTKPAATHAKTMPEKTPAENTPAITRAKTTPVTTPAETTPASPPATISARRQHTKEVTGTKFTKKMKKNNDTLQMKKASPISYEPQMAGNNAEELITRITRLRVGIGANETREVTVTTASKKKKNKNYLKMKEASPTSLELQRLDKNAQTREVTLTTVTKKKKKKINKPKMKGATPTILEPQMNAKDTEVSKFIKI